MSIFRIFFIRTFKYQEKVSRAHSLFRVCRKGKVIPVYESAHSHPFSGVRSYPAVCAAVLLAAVLLSFAAEPVASAEVSTVPELMLWGPGHAECERVGMDVSSVRVTFVPDSDIVSGGYTVSAGSVPERVETYDEEWTVSGSGGSYLIECVSDAWSGTRAVSFVATYPVVSGQDTLRISVEWLVWISDLERLYVN